MKQRQLLIQDHNGVWYRYWITGTCLEIRDSNCIEFSSGETLDGEMLGGVAIMDAVHYTPEEIALYTEPRPKKGSTNVSKTFNRR